MEQNKEEKYVQLLNSLFVENLEKFTDEFIPNPIAPNIRSISSPILHKMDMEMVTKKVMEMDRAKDIETLNKMVYYRFGDDPHSRWKEEMCFLEAIMQGLNTLSDDEKTLSAIYKRQILFPRIAKLLKA